MSEKAQLCICGLKSRNPEFLKALAALFKAAYRAGLVKATKRTRPKFKPNDRVTYAGDKRIRHTIARRYWDGADWRYKMTAESLRGMRGDVAACWSVIESELILVKRGRS